MTARASWEVGGRPALLSIQEQETGSLEQNNTLAILAQGHVGQMQPQHTASERGLFAPVILPMASR